MKRYTSAPLPFQGQKRRFIPQFVQTLQQCKNKTTFVDLFGGSGLLAHTTKRILPDATVVFNDYDNYSERIAHISQTNALLADLREIVGNSTPSRERIIPKREEVLQRIRTEEEKTGYVDFITLSSNLFFSTKYKSTFEGFTHNSFFNRIVQHEYSAEGYLEGLEVVSCDYRRIYAQYKGNSNVVYLIDPPYLQTDTSTYKQNWKLADYLNVLDVLQESSFVLFTSGQSSLIELCEWLATKGYCRNPLEKCEQYTMCQKNNYHSQYQDIMSFKL